MAGHKVTSNNPGVRSSRAYGPEGAQSAAEERIMQSGVRISRFRWKSVVGLAAGVSFAVLGSGVASAQFDTRPGPAQPVTIQQPLPVPVEIFGGANGDPAAAIPVEVVGQPAAEYVTFSGSGSIGCSFGPNGDECSAFVVADVVLPDGKDLIVETISVFWGPNRGSVPPATAVLQHDAAPFQRHVLGALLPVAGLTGADAGVSASLSFLATGDVSVIVSFPDDPPDGDVVSATAYVAGRLIDEPAESP